MPFAIFQRPPIVRRVLKRVMRGDFSRVLATWLIVAAPVPIAGGAATTSQPLHGDFGGASTSVVSNEPARPYLPKVEGVQEYYAFVSGMWQRLFGRQITSTDGMAINATFAELDGATPGDVFDGTSSQGEPFAFGIQSIQGLPIPPLDPGSVALIQSWNGRAGLSTDQGIEIIDFTLIAHPSGGKIIVSLLPHRLGQFTFGAAPIQSPVDPAIPAPNCASSYFACLEVCRLAAETRRAAADLAYEACIAAAEDQLLSETAICLVGLVFPGSAPIVAACLLAVLARDLVAKSRCDDNYTLDYVNSGILHNACRETCAITDAAGGPCP